MRKFSFRLATMLRLREATRDERRSQLAEAFRIADAIQERLDELGQHLDDLKLQQAARPGRVDVDRLVAAHRYEMVLRVEQRQNEEQHTAVLAEVERRRETLAVADREVRTLEKLRETQQQRHRSEEERQLMKELDEIAARPCAGGSRMIGKLARLVGALVVYFAIGTTLSLVVGLVWLGKSGALERDKLMKMAAIARGVDLTAIREEVDAQREKINGTQVSIEDVARAAAQGVRSRAARTGLAHQYLASEIGTGRTCRRKKSI